MTSRRRSPEPGAAEPSASLPDAARLAGALAAAPDGVVIVDQTGREVLRNEAAERFRDARHTDALAEAALGELLTSAARGEGGERELHLFGPPREHLALRARPLVVDGAIVGGVAFIRDVTEAHRIESVRRDFVANVSHELKTPIGALALLAETMATGGDEAVMRPLADRIAREADRLARIIDDLLDLSLIEAQEAPSREPEPARTLLEEAVERVRATAAAAGTPLAVGVVPSDTVIECDRRQVLSALTNLLDNAIKYSERGKSVDVDASVEDGLLLIAVRDHGIGIPSRDLERIFERFYRVDRARSRATGGTGLGLAIVRHVAQAHGGDVTVESQEGEGSTFRLRLPLVRGVEET